VTPPPRKFRFSPKFFWAAILVILFVVTVVWFINPLGKMEETRQQPGPFANPTEWSVKPTGPAVDVTLPTTPVTMVPAAEPERAN